MQITKEYAEYYSYLNNLRASGITNMYGAAPYLANEFGITKDKARKILSSWMENYDEVKDF